MNLPSLKPGTICLALLIPDNSTLPNHIFHWAFIIPIKTHSFILHHIGKSNLADEWLYNNPQYDVVQVRSLCVVAELGEISIEEVQIAAIENILRGIPIIESLRLSSGLECPLTCRVWIKDAIRLLTQEGILIDSSCDDVVEVVKKVWEFGIAHRDKKKSGKPFALYSLVEKQ